MIQKPLKAEIHLNFVQKSERTSEKTQSLSIPNTSPLMLYQDTVAGSSERHTKHVSALCTANCGVS